MVGRNVEARGIMREAFKCWKCAKTWLYDPAREMPECPDGCGPKPKKKPGRKPKPKRQIVESETRPGDGDGADTGFRAAYHLGLPAG